jgi:hypothetical protein
VSQKILACVEWNDATNTCTTQAWIDQPSLVPPLTVDDARSIGFAFAFLWAVAWGIRMARKTLQQS